MRSSPIASGLLAASGLLLVDLIAWVLAQNRPFPSPEQLFWYALMFSQTGLICVWSSLSTAILLWRGLGAAGCLVAIGLALGTVHNSAGMWLMLLLLQAAVIGLPLGWARSRGVRLSRIDALTATARPLQFSLRHMLWGTTGVATFMAVVRTLDMSSQLPRGQMVGEFFVLGGALGAIGLASAWAGWGASSRAMRFALSLAVSAAAGLVMALAMAPGNEFSLVWLAIGTGALSGAYLSLLRRRGYGLVWQAAAAPAE